jgi:hypothetical protein
MDRLKKMVPNRSAALDILATEPRYHKDFQCWSFDRMDGRIATTVVDTFNFFNKEAAVKALEYVKALQQ